MPPASASSALADRIAARLAAYLGPHTARVAVKTFAQKALARGPETITLADWPKLEAAFRPMLRTLVGTARADVVLSEIRRDIGA